MFELIIGLCCFIIAMLLPSVTQTPCARRVLGEGRTVCVCNSTYCDTIERVDVIPENQYVMFISSEEGMRFEKSSHPFCDSPEGFMHINVTDEKFQTIFGFGGAFTDSTGVNILSLGKRTQRNLLRSYFSSSGLEYNLCRVPIGGTDFSTHPYTYNDNDDIPDPGLKNFSLAFEDYTYKIPLIKRAKEMSGREIRLFSGAWSSPAWMKTNNNITGPGRLKLEYYENYANYLLRFLDEYRRNNVPIWAISTQNEPQHGLYEVPFTEFNALGWTAEEMSNWVTCCMGPRLRNSAHKNVVLLTYEDQRDRFYNWTTEFEKTHKEALNFIQGFGVHWYYDNITSPDILTSVHCKYPDKFILYTEACIIANVKDIFGLWFNGEQYMRSIIQAINNWSTGWVHWNLALNENGGPKWNQEGDMASQILVNTNADEFYKDSTFYAMGHVSKFIERGSIRLGVNPTNRDGILTMAVLNPEQRTVIVILNENSCQKEVSIHVAGKGWINQKLPKKSMATILSQG